MPFDAEVDANLHPEVGNRPKYLIFTTECQFFEPSQYNGISFARHKIDKKFQLTGEENRNRRMEQ
jgi:hypothetical protein